MIFSSIPFLYYFLPVVLTLYLITPKKLKNATLLISSLVFYGWGEPKYVFLMIFTVFVGYLMALLIEKTRGKLISKIFFIISVASSVAGLLYFKYADFFITNFNAVTGLSVPLLKLVLPIGISFYTFQILSYSVDVYIGRVKAQKNFITLAAYVALFPQLIAGPIVRYTDVEKQLTERTHSFEKISQGIYRFIIGLSKKILIANTLGEMCEGFLISNDLSVMYYWMYAICFMLQVYFDFSGYSDMAIGLGKILGFDFMENFNYPFISKSITEFWRRWHISLGSWFRDYVYIPLGGNKKGKIRQLINIFVVWFLTGFWHGAEWNFILWGVYFGVLLTLEKFFYLKKLDKHPVISYIYMFFFVTVSFMIFASGSLSQTVDFVGGLFGRGSIPLVSREAIYHIRNYGFVILIAVLGATPLPKNIYLSIKKRFENSFIIDICEIVFCLLLMIVVTGYLADGSFNPFLYFRF